MGLENQQPVCLLAGSRPPSRDEAMRFLYLAKPQHPCLYGPVKSCFSTYSSLNWFLSLTTSRALILKVERGGL